MNQITTKLYSDKIMHTTSLNYIYIIENLVLKQYELIENDLILLFEYKSNDPIIAITSTLSYILYTTSRQSVLLSYKCEFILNFPKLGLLRSIDNQLFGTQHNAIVFINSKSLKLNVVHESNETVLDFSIFSSFLFILTVDSVIQVNLVLNQSNVILKYTLFDKITSISCRQVNNSTALYFIQNNKQSSLKISNPISNLLSKNYMDEAIIYLDKSLKLPVFNFSDCLSVIQALLDISLESEANSYLGYFDQHYLFLIKHRNALDLIQLYCSIYRHQLNEKLLKTLQSIFNTSTPVKLTNKLLVNLDFLLCNSTAAVDLKSINPVILEKCLPMLESLELKYQCTLILNNPNKSIPYALKLGLQNDALQIAKNSQINKSTLELLLGQIDYKYLADYFIILRKSNIEANTLEYPLNQCYKLHLKDYDFVPKSVEIDANMVSMLRYHKWDTFTYGLNENIKHYILAMYIWNAPQDKVEQLGLTSLCEYYYMLHKCKHSIMSIPVYIQTYGDIMTVIRHLEISNKQTVTIIMRCILKMENTEYIDEIKEFLSVNISLVDGDMLLDTLPNWNIYDFKEILIYIMQKKYHCKNELMTMRRTKMSHRKQHKFLYQG